MCERIGKKPSPKLGKERGRWSSCVLEKEIGINDLHGYKVEDDGILVSSRKILMVVRVC